MRLPVRLSSQCYRSVGVLVLMMVGALGAMRGSTLWAAPREQAPVVGVDAVTTPVSTAQPVLVPTAEVATAQTNVTDAAYHAQFGQQRYVIEPGDTLLKVALETGADIAQLPCAIAPDFQLSQPLVIGDTIVVPEPEIICHRTGAGETLNAIAARYRITPAQISARPWNQLDGVAGDAILPANRNIQIPQLRLAGDSLMAGEQNEGRETSGTDSSFLTWMLEQPIDTSPFLALAVGGPFAGERAHANQNRATVSANQPGAIPENWPYGSGNFIWPLAGWLTQGYRYDHRALDIAAPFGTAVAAADRGVVVRAGWNNQGYGLFVIIDHNIDYLTLYAHLSAIMVEEGQVVGQGAIIGSVGSTGNSTGPHLHFEIRDFGRLTNPLELLAHP